MTLLRRFSFLLVPLAIGAGSAALPSRAQTPSSRFAFSDTTLLRDTLGLSFANLFPIADSLRITPDTLRALAVRYRFSPERLVQFADSMRVPIDSVGVILERERFNPFLNASETRFTYNTTYSIQQTRNSWGNGSDFSYSRGPFFVRNTTQIQMDRQQTGSRTTLYQTRTATTEVGWKLAPDYSLGGRAVLNRLNSDDPSSPRPINDTQGDYQVSARMRQSPVPGLSTEFNLFSGILDVDKLSQQKHGLSGDANGRVEYRRGEWLTHQVEGRINGNAARTRVPPGDEAQTHDLARSVKASMNLFQNAPAAFNGTLNAQDSRVASGAITGARVVRTGSVDLDGTIRLTRGPEHYVNLVGGWGRSHSPTTIADQTRSRRGLGADGRTTLRGWSLEGRFANDRSTLDNPRADSSGGYGEDIETRTLEGTLSRQLTAKLVGRLQASIGLTIYRSAVIDSYPSPPVPNDQYRQGYRIEGIYTFSQKFNSGVTLDVSRSGVVNLPSASTSANNITRSYRAEWRWTYRLFRGLTATQRNTLAANYQAFNFLTNADKLNLDYGTVTTLNAVLTPRLTVNLTHSGQESPSGNYLLNPDDGVYYFSPGGRSKVFELKTEIAYTPISGFSLNVSPRYRAQDRTGSVNGVLVPQSGDRSLSFTSSGSLNVPLYKRGQLSGTFGRSYDAARNISYAGSRQVRSPRSEREFWNGNLQFSWRL